MEDKYIELKKAVLELINDGVCIAFSGGVDSSLILKIACDIAGKANENVYAVTFNTKLHPSSDITISKDLAKQMGAIHRVIEVNEFQNEKILNNSVDRCYECKKYLYSELFRFAREHDLKYVVDGTNADDLKTYRPGIKALNELGVVSPLAKLGITKKEVRKIAKELNISVATRPSTPCLATRLPYNTRITLDLLKKIEKAEEYIKGLGFNIIRVRVHRDIARIEVNKEEFAIFLEKKDLITDYLKDLGFVYITLDLEGFRSGSMDVKR